MKRKFDICEVLELYSVDLDRGREMLYDNFRAIMPRRCFDVDRTIYIHDLDDLISECFFETDQRIQRSIGEWKLLNAFTCMQVLSFIKWNIRSYIRRLDKEQWPITSPLASEWWYAKKLKFVKWYGDMSVYFFGDVYPVLDSEDYVEIMSDHVGIDTKKLDIEYTMNALNWLPYEDHKLLTMRLSWWSSEDMIYSMQTAGIWKNRTPSKVSKRLKSIFNDLKQKLNETTR